MIDIVMLHDRYSNYVIDIVTPYDRYSNAI